MKESRIKHLEFVHNTINRLSHKSFLVKSWSITLITGLLAFGIEKQNLLLFYLAIPVVLLFWFLDTYYLWLEKVFRALYDGILEKSVKPLSMDISDFKNSTKFFKVLFRPTVISIYLSEILLILFSIIYICSK
jgi:hypothetical protein